MPMSLAGEYLYFLTVILLYGSPIIVVVLFVYGRRDRLLTGLKTIVILVPLVALSAQVLFRGSVLLAGVGLDCEAGRIDAYLKDPTRTDVVLGSFVGTYRVGGMDYRRYQFPSLDGSMEYGLEVSVPPDGIGAIGHIRLSEDYEPGLADARLLVWPRHIGMNPAMDTAEFFRRYYPGQQPEAFGPHTLIVGLRPNQSIVVYPYASSANWRWTNASLDLSAP